MQRLSSFTLIIILFLSGYGPLSAEEKRPISHEDVWLMKRLSAPVVSPDGSLAIVSVTEPAYEEDGDQSDLWLIDVSARVEPRRLTATAEGESDVAWSPDGKRIAFATKREQDEVSQIYTLAMDGPGEAIAITGLSTGASKPVWSPNGKRIAFESRVYPGAIDDEANLAEKKAREERKTNVSVYEIFPVRQWDRWRDDLQTHLFVQDAAAGAVAQDLFAGVKLIEGPGFSGTSTRSGDTLNARWAPEGQSLVFNATTNLDEAAHSRVIYHLFGISVSGGEPHPITKGSDYSCVSPRFSDDGDTLYCTYEAENLEVYNLTRIAKLPWSGGTVSTEPEVLGGSFDRSVSGMDISRDGRTIYLTAADAGRSRIYRMPSGGGEVTALNINSRGVYSGIQSTGTSLVAGWESSAEPAEIVRVNVRDGSHLAISNFNSSKAARLDRPAYQEFWFESSKGRRIHNWLSLPAGFDETRKYPLVLQIHGGPFSSSMDSSHLRWSAGLMSAPGYVVLMTDYTGSVGYGEQFSRNIQGDPLKTPGEEILEAAQAAIDRYPFIDGSRQVATGASYGGHLVNWLQAQTSHFKALIGHAGLVDLEGQYSSSDTIFNREIMNGGPAWGDSPVWQDQSPSSYADQFSTPILLTIGEKDFRVPVNQTIAAWSYVNRVKIPGRLLVFHDANHWVMKGEEARYYWQEVHAWLARYLAENPQDESRAGFGFGVEIGTGTIAGAHYTIAKPANWNGKLLLVAHGHRFEDRPLDGSLDTKQAVYARLLADGWMLATSSYRRNGIIVRDAIEDLDLLRQHIVNVHGQPERTLLVGNSMGGAIGTIIAETRYKDFDGILAIGAALGVLDPIEPYDLTHQPEIPILFLSNQSEITEPEQYVQQAGNAPVAPALWRVSRDGHVNVNNAELESAIRALDRFVDTGEIDRHKDGTIIGGLLESTAEFTEQGAVSVITAVSKNFGNFFTGFVARDLERMGINQGSHFSLDANGQVINVFWGITYRDVNPGEWVAFISAEGNLMVAKNTGNACEAIDCKAGDRLLLLAR